MSSNVCYDGGSWKAHNYICGPPETKPTYAAEESDEEEEEDSEDDVVYDQAIGMDTPAGEMSVEWNDGYYDGGVYL